MLTLLLLACTEPPVIDPVEEALANRVLELAEPQIRLFVGIAGVIAETCTVDRMSEYTFIGEAAAALGVTVAGVSESASGDKTWTFDDVGLDDQDGVLVLTTDTERTNFTVTYTATNDTLANGEFHILSCEGGASDTADTGTGSETTANVSGNLDVTTSSETNHVYIDGDKPYSALTWTPATARAPLAGWVHWGDTEINPTEEVTLEGASQIDYGAGAWPGKASGARWARTVTVALP